MDMLPFLATLILLISTPACTEVQMAYDDEESALLNVAREKDEGAALGWAASGELECGNPSKAVQLQVLFPIAGQYTIQFKVDPKTKSTLKYARPQAEITWSVAGNQVSRKIDVTDGASISGIGEGVRVKVTDRSTTVDATNKYVAGITVGKGGRGVTQSPPTIRAFENVQSVIGGATLNIPIPANSGVKEYMVLVGMSAAWTAGTDYITVSQENDVGLISQHQLTTEEQFWIPLAANATKLVFTNMTGEEVFVNIVFGVDG